MFESYRLGESNTHNYMGGCFLVRRADGKYFDGIGWEEDPNLLRRCQTLSEAEMLRSRAGEGEVIDLQTEALRRQREEWRRRLSQQ